MRFLSDSPLPGSAIFRHAYRHRDKLFSMRFSVRRDGRDACDGRLQAFSRQEAASLLRRLSYSFNLPLQSRRKKRETLLCRSGSRREVGRGIIGIPVHRQDDRMGTYKGHGA
jgi:hypothetical protein